MKKIASLLIAPILANILLAAVLHAQPAALVDLAQFERKATLSKELGATHVVVTEGLPLATWEFDPTIRIRHGSCTM